MSHSSLFIAIVSSAAAAAVPVQFNAGTKASADDVNRNFAYIDSTKANKSGVELLTASVNGNTMATSALATRHDSLVGAVKSHVDTAKLSKGLGAKADTSALAGLRAAIPTTANLGIKADTTWVNGKLQGKADASLSRILRDTAGGDSSNRSWLFRFEQAGGQLGHAKFCNCGRLDQVENRYERICIGSIERRR